MACILERVRDRNGADHEGAMIMDRKYGAKYAKDADIKDIAKMVRADIKAAVAAGTLPVGIKVSIRIDRYSMGQSLDAEIVALPFPAWAMKPMGGGGDVGRELVRRPSDRADAAMKAIGDLIAAYNHDGSDSMVDHFDVNFYSHITLNRDLELEGPAPVPVVPEWQRMAAIVSKFEQVAILLKTGGDRNSASDLATAAALELAEVVYAESGAARAIDALVQSATSAELASNVIKFRDRINK